MSRKSLGLCPRCMEYGITYNGNYFCENPICGWALKPYETIPTGGKRSGGKRQVYEAFNCLLLSRLFAIEELKSSWPGNSDRHRIEIGKSIDTPDEISKLYTQLRSYETKTF